MNAVPRPQPLTPRARRILIEMPYPGFLRIYESTIRLLAQRGHEVLLAYDTPDKKDGVALLPAAAGANVTFAGAVPWRRRLWTGLTRHTRIGADYLRYLGPRFRQAKFLRRRMEKYLPPRLSFLTRVRGLQSGTVDRWLRLLAWLETGIPTDPVVDEWLQSQRPDAVIVTPLVTRGEGAVRQTETVKSAKRLGIPVGLAVASWDHLSSKGVVRGEPDAVFVWNEIQKQEAFELHGIPAERVVVTGAQIFDQWFEKRPLVSRAEFHSRAGLGGERPFLLYVGSSRGIAPGESELSYVRKWLAALRLSADPALQAIPVLIRPHPMNAKSWQHAELKEFGDVAVWLRTPPIFPMSDVDQADYFHSLHYCSAVVGINTSAMVEAAIVGRPVFTIRGQELADSQDGTLHFQYLLPEAGGCLRAAGDLQEHLAQLADALRRPESTAAEIASFVRSFVRPHGLDVACTPLLADAVERLADSPRLSERTMPARLLPLRALLTLPALFFAGAEGSADTAGQPKAARSGAFLSRIYHALRKDRLGFYDAFSRTIREDRDPPRRFYAALRRLMAPQTLLSRRKVARRFAGGASFRIPPEDGFQIVRAGVLPEADEVVAAARQIAQASDPMELIRKGRKAFMVNLLDNTTLTRESPFLRLALRPDVLASVSEYLGVVPILTHIDVFFSSSADKRMISSKLFHCDGDDTTQVKLFVLCSDVKAENGPLTILPASASERVRRTLRYKYGTRLTDEEVEAVVGDAGRRAATGPAGTICLVDTSRCFHFGSRVEDEAQPRLVTMIQYSTPFSFMLPRDPRRRAPFRHLGSADAVELERLVLAG